MAEFILHVGDGKCGSSSIQASLYEAREDLGRAGLIYETATPKSGHFSLVRLIGEQTRGDDEVQLALARKTLDLIRARLPRNRHILLSAENFFTLDPERVVALCRMISPEISGIKVISYVRPPVSMYLSLVQQTLKAHHFFGLPQNYQRPIDRCLSRWTSLVGADNIASGIFDRDLLYRHSVVPDFARRLSALTGIDVSLGASEANTSLTAEQLVVLQTMRATHFADSPGKRRPESEALEQLFLRLNRIRPLGTPLGLSRAAKQAVSANNCEIVRRVRPLLQDGERFGDPATRTYSGMDDKDVGISPFFQFVRLALSKVSSLPRSRVGYAELGTRARHL